MYLHVPVHKSKKEECKKITFANKNHGGLQGAISSSRKNHFYIDMCQAIVTIHMP